MTTGLFLVRRSGDELYISLEQGDCAEINISSSLIVFSVFFIRCIIGLSVDIIDSVVGCSSEFVGNSVNGQLLSKK